MFVFGKFGVFCFLETPVFRFALLPYYGRCHLVIQMTIALIKTTLNIIFYDVRLTISSILDWVCYTVAFVRLPLKKRCFDSFYENWFIWFILIYLCFISVNLHFIEYRRQVWTDAPNYYLNILDKLQKRICMPAIATRVDTLEFLIVEGIGIIVGGLENSSKHKRRVGINGGVGRLIAGWGVGNFIWYVKIEYGETEVFWIVVTL